MVFRKGVCKFLGLFLAVGILFPGLFLAQEVEAAGVKIDFPATEVQMNYCSRLYKYGLGRPDSKISTGEVYSWAYKIQNRILSPEDVTRGIFLSPEGTNYSNLISDKKFVSNLYQGVLGRTEDSEGYKINLGFLTNVKREMIKSLTGDDNRSRFFSTTTITEGTNAQFIREIYLRFLNRNPTTAEFNLQMGKLMKSREELLNAFLSSAEYKNKRPQILDRGWEPIRYRLDTIR